MIFAPRWKLNRAVEKWVLKEAVRDLLPGTVVDRPKSGMRVPVQQWLGGPLKELAGDLLLSREARARRRNRLAAWPPSLPISPRQGGGPRRTPGRILYAGSLVDGSSIAPLPEGSTSSSSPVRTLALPDSHRSSTMNAVIRHPLAPRRRCVV
ncbi:asparagine synthase-related protein [Streptomyces acidicola]|uniref:asparagine synthase-related protein n=1 Tax=Streptomyces acidicola TaxID=2596892 RepID=UPI0037A72FA1